MEQGKQKKYMILLKAGYVPSTVHPIMLGTPLAGPGCSLHLNSQGGSKPLTSVMSTSQAGQVDLRQSSSPGVDRQTGIMTLLRGLLAV